MISQAERCPDSSGAVRCTLAVEHDSMHAAGRRGVLTSWLDRSAPNGHRPTTEDRSETKESPGARRDDARE